MDVKTTCMGVLAWGEASGYEIRKHFEDGPFSHFAEGGYGSIYPALNKLTAEGLVSCTEYAQDKRPDKKIYRLTDAGRDALVAALHEPPAEDRYKSDLLFVLFFADYLPPEMLARLIDARIAFYRHKLAQMGVCGDPDEAAAAGVEPAPGCSPTTHAAAGPRFVHGFGETVYRAALDYLETNKAALIAEVAARRNGAGDVGRSESALASAAE